MAETSRTTQHHKYRINKSTEQAPTSEPRRPPHTQPHADQPSSPLKTEAAPAKADAPASENLRCTGGMLDRAFGANRDWPATHPSHTRLMPSSLRPPAPRPCSSCPYRRDATSGTGQARSTRSSAAMTLPPLTSRQPCSNATKPMPTVTLAASAQAGPDATTAHTCSHSGWPCSTATSTRQPTRPYSSTYPRSRSSPPAAKQPLTARQTSIYPATKPFT